MYTGSKSVSNFCVHTTNIQIGIEVHVNVRRSKVRKELAESCITHSEQCVLYANDTIGVSNVANRPVLQFVARIHVVNDILWLSDHIKHICHVLVRLRLSIAMKTSRTETYLAWSLHLTKCSRLYPIDEIPKPLKPRCPESLHRC